MPDKIMIQVRFSKQTSIGEYNDALYYTQAEYASIAPAVVEAEKQARVDAWMNAVKNAPPPVEPTKEELQAQKTYLEEQLTDVNTKLLIAKSKVII